MLRFGEYASPKNFVFPTKRLLREMDRARWVRQRINETNIITIHDMTAKKHSINKLDNTVNSVV